MRKNDENTITLDTEILELFVAANELRYNGKVFSRDWDDNWSGSWDNGIAIIEG